MHPLDALLATNLICRPVSAPDGAELRAARRLLTRLALAAIAIVVAATAVHASGATLLARL